MDPFDPSAAGEQTTSRYSLSKPGYFSRMLHIIAVVQDWRTICRGSSSARTFPYTSESPLEVFSRIIFFDKMPAGFTLASIAQSYGRPAIRVSYPVLSYLYRFPLIQRIFNGLESRHIFPRYVLFYENVGEINEQVVDAQRLPDLIGRTFGRRMFVTERGYVGLAPEMTELGCCVAIVKGGKLPLILKPREHRKWELIGDCYVQGIMHGEGFEHWKCTEMEIV